MARVKTQVVHVNLPDTAASRTDVAKLRIYYMKGTGPMVDANQNALDGIAFVDIPYVADQLRYGVTLGGVGLPVTDGQWTLGVSSLDESDNESDVSVITRPFDFTPPPKPSWE
jgi:hypothetical protein